MPFIVYSCVTADGGVDWRSGSYDTLDALYDELRKRGEQIDRFYELPEAVDHLVSAMRGRLRPAQVVEFCNYLSLYVQGGLDLQTALADLVQGTRESSVKYTAEQIRRDLLNGVSLSQAMERSRQFPEVAVSMASIGEASGNLAQMLGDAAAYIGRIEEIKSASLRAVIYPAFTLGMMLITGLFWMLMVVPKLANVYRSMDVELPLATRTLISMSDFASSGWPWLIAAAGIIPVSYSLARRQRDLRQVFDRIAWGAPIFGNVVRNAQEAFFFQYLALVYKAGVPITEAISGLIGTTQNRHFRSRIRRIPEHLRIGLSLREAFQRCNIFSPLDIRMVAIGEQTGALDAQLAKLSTIYMQRVQAAVELLTKAIEPLLMLLMGAFFAFFVVAMLGPIYSLIANMMSSMGGQ